MDKNDAFDSVFKRLYDDVKTGNFLDVLAFLGPHTHEKELLADQICKELTRLGIVIQTNDSTGCIKKPAALALDGARQQVFDRKWGIRWCGGCRIRTVARSGWRIPCMGAPWV